MFERFRNISLIYQLSLFTLLAAVVVFAVQIGFVSHKTSQDFLNAQRDSLSKEVGLVAGDLELFHDSLANRTGQLGDIFFRMFPGGITLDTSRTARVGQYDAPMLVNEGQDIDLNFAKPDKFTEMTGGTATVFVRYGDDFLRVSTSLRKENGDRAFGTLLGKSHPGYATLMRGEVYAGPAYLFGRHYMTKYIPFKDAKGQVIGILYVGFDYTDDMAALKAKLASIRFGDTGYVYAIDARPGPKQGTLVIHPTLAGKNLLEIADAAGGHPFRQLLEGERGFLEYPWANSGGEAQPKMVAYQHVKGWDWVVAAGSYNSEFTKSSAALRNTMLGIAALSAAVLVGLIFLALRRQLRPLARIGQAMRALGQGDLTVRLDVDCGDAGTSTSNEIRFLARQVSQMIDQLHRLISDVLASVEAMGGAAQRVASVTEQTRTGVERQQSETDQVATAVNEMAATAQEVARGAAATAGETQQADGQAAEGRDSVAQVTTAIKALAHEVEQAAEVINRVEDDSTGIGKIIEVIRGVAEQTNLLALNAAIEAARAGEQGRGFAVVADEVRTLAQKTQQSTTEIQQMIERLQSSTNEAVKAMQSGRDRARDSVERASEAGVRLDGIAGAVSNIASMATHIASAAEEQTTVAEDISRSVVNIRDIAGQTADGAEELANASGELQSISGQLTQTVGRFKV